ncbi:MAG: arylsulfatase [Candidatus Hodarchaeota archaeon]
MATNTENYPNIIFILADDMGYGDLGCYGSEKIPTPNMDKIASEGIRFTDAHSSSAVCSPSRYSILTGRYCWRTKLKRSVLWGYSFPLIEPERPTIATLLKKRGYHTAAIGKWHVGLKWPTRNYEPLKNPHTRNPDIDFSKPIKGGPTSLGFDYFFGISGSLDMPPYCFIENEHTIGIPSLPKEPLYQQQSEGLMVPGWRDDKVDVKFTEKAIQFIQEHVKSESAHPLFIYLCTSAPHRPCDVQPEFIKGKSQAGDRGDMVILVDWVVGQINDELENLGLIENTLIMITSDNGARATCFNGEDYGHNSNGSWRGQKGDIWEGGHREPLIARWPNHIKPNIVSKEPLCLVDLFATLAALLDLPITDGVAEDSFNMLPALLGKQQVKQIRDSIIHHSMWGTFSIRHENWKLIKGRGSGGFTLPAKIIPRKGEPKGQLYDLNKDPEEQSNLWNDKPKIVGNLEDLLNHIKKKK